MSWVLTSQENGPIPGKPLDGDSALVFSNTQVKCGACVCSDSHKAWHRSGWISEQAFTVWYSGNEAKRVLRVTAMTKTRLCLFPLCWWMDLNVAMELLLLNMFLGKIGSDCISCVTHEGHAQGAFTLSAQITVLDVPLGSQWSMILKSYMAWRSSWATVCTIVSVCEQSWFSGAVDEATLLLLPAFGIVVCVRDRIECEWSIMAPLSSHITCGPLGQTIIT